MQAEASAKERGFAALRQGDPQSAAQLLTEVVRGKPDDAEAWSALGVALCQQQRVAEGQQALARAVTLAPTRAPLHFNLAKGLELGGRQSEALASYRSAVQHDPGHAGARDAVQRLTPGSDAGSPPQPSIPGVSPLADFALGPAPNPSPPAPSSSNASSNPLTPPPPSVRYGHPPSSTGPLMPMGAAYQAPSAPPAPVQVPRRGTPWGLILGICAVLAVVGIGMVVVLAAVMLPAFQGARKAAQQARARAEMRGQYSTPPGFAGSFTPSPPADFGQPSTTPSSELDRPGGGGEVRDQLFGFSAAFPTGFAAPMPEQNNRSVGLGGTASTQTYRATTSSGVAYILCYAFSPDVYDQVENQLFNLGQSGLRKSARGRFRSSSTRYQGYAAQEVSYGGAAGGQAGARPVDPGEAPAVFDCI